MGIYYLPISAFLGSLLAIILVYIISRVKGRINITHLLLSGMVITMIMDNLTSIIKLSAPNALGLHNAEFWMSGGEKQRVLLARTVAQESDFLILDEPTNHLDINYQIQMFDFIKRLKVTVLSAMHDLNMAALYCDKLYAMKDGNIMFGGTPEEVLTEENIRNIFGVKCSVAKHPITNKTSVTYFPHWINPEGK